MYTTEPATDVTDTTDLDDVEAIVEMVRRFYAQVDTDDLLGPIFNDVAQVDWETHLPKLTAFWSRALLGIPGFEGNPMGKHIAAHQQSPFTIEHFERWLTLFVQTVDGGWSGPNVDRALTLAHGVAQAHARMLGARRSTPGT